ncbi:hypothetical protein Bca4012_083239 [Brassica carinata]
MEEPCLVLSGDWVCGEEGKWDFVVEKNRMGRMVQMYEGIGCKELEGNVLREFKLDEGRYRVALSYWPPTSSEIATGIRTPPVLITNEVALKYFCQHQKVKGGMNLFAKIESRKESVDVEVVDDSGLGFVSPKEYVSSAASKTRVCDIEDDEDLVREVEKVETKLMSESLKGESSKAECESGCSLGTEEEGGFKMDEISLRPKGYDKEFWKPLLAGDFGGSDAVDVVYNEDEIIEAITKKKGPRTYFCDTQSCFDHYVEVGGGGRGADVAKDEKPETYNPWMGGGAQGEAINRSSVPKRRLEEIDDEEFDIPPLFDDTEFDAAEIPDMDVDECDSRIEVGKVFGSKEDCQIALVIYAIKQQFKFTQTRTKIDSFVVECPDSRCDWRVTAHEVRGCGYYEIRKAQLNHSCPIEFRNGYKSKATSRVIAAVYKAKFGDTAKPPVARELQRLVLEDLRVDASYMKCYREKDKAILGLRGSDEDSYLKLPEYLHMLKLANPCTIADLETDVDEDGDERFLYLFLAFGASISGFRKLRHVLVIDGTHLSGKYKGVLLTASGQDANFQIFPLAFAVVDAEDEDAWTWFLQKVERILGDSPSLAIISDRAVCISNAVSKIYPQAKHGACIVHLARNVNSRFSSKNLAKMVTSAAMAHNLGEFKNLYAKIRATNSARGIYLGKIGVARWSRANFPGDRYNIMTSNIAEQLNKALLEGRGAAIVELITFIQRMMTRWFCARRKKAERHRGLVSVEVDKQMTKNLATVNGSKINAVNSWSSQILGKFGKSNKVMLAERKCCCKYFDNIKIPCGHAMLAANGVGMPHDTLCGHWYKTTVWRETYAGEISPHGDARDVDIPEEVSSMVLYPPNTKRQSGRRRKTRIPSTGEIRVPQKKLTRNKCGRCKGVGHNRTNCTVPI